MRINGEKAIFIDLGGLEDADIYPAIETITVATERETRWIIMRRKGLSTRMVGVLDESPTEHFLRRPTGGLPFPTGGDVHYTALLGPRIGGAPPSLQTIHSTVQTYFARSNCKVNPLLRVECGQDAVIVAVGKLGQRPFIEAAGSIDAIDNLIKGLEIVGEAELDPDMIKMEARERYRSEEWNWRGIQGATHRFERITSKGAKLVFEVKLEPPFILESRLYTNAFIYPPAQALLLISQLQDAPPAKTLAFEFLHGWATLVESVGVEYVELKDFLLDAFERLGRDAGL
ncbi:MAG: hypothetical protein F7C35_05890 [Desulfurococcales archaeon]|nr:hypothetical protein [Desulfurococcales archaeon]